MDYYSILGVSKTASPEEIKRAYRQKVKQHHPDAGGDAEQFKKVSEAYETLSNSDKRSAYDNPQADFNFRSQNFSQHNPFHDMFSNFGFHQNIKNRDLYYSVTIDLLDVMKGKDILITYTIGSGRHETVTVNIPAGANTGDTVRYDGLGDDSNPRFPRGDLLVKIRVAGNKTWTRDGNNIATKKRINVFDLMLGCVTIVETLDGRKVKLNVPQATKPGTILSINGYGIPDLRTKKPGNLYVQIDTEIPKITDNEILQKIHEIKRNLDNG